ncbi:DUF1415 domain-containing protein [Aliidiomarina halalkaliphila]|uniref:DUF1415 domain-containing protein n=1 Tax=Aliidiomarina halalkaliphila TaxID=2593535 RepID=A0A552X3F6_9GAMM|nr:DUF1415 domain-containing protein [Aliidiomarina halalkaliphila]TRW49552.1 DUF1415 domain-containing protein [Aliidiomarina halalkaliphila]
MLTTEKTEDQKLIATQRWLERVVIAHNFCPFAKPVVRAERVRYRLLDARNVEQLLHELRAECDYLDQHSETATSLLVLNHLGEDFYDYLDLVADADHWLAQENYEGIYQVASFHPEYVFAGTQASDPSNFTNRSPYPLLHILREDDVTTALADWRDPENIPERNIRHARALGTQYFRDLLIEIDSEKS